MLHSRTMEQITGYIERITYQNGDNGYTVAQLQIPKNTQTTCIVGMMPDLQPGTTVCCTGKWKNHLVYGQQFDVSSYKIEAPADLLGIRKYLGSGLVKGIGPKFAERIVDRFGVETLRIIDADPGRLHEVEGIGTKRVELIKECWQAQKIIRDVMIFLQRYSVSPIFAQKIFKTYGQDSIRIVQETPYALARDIFGVGFKTADQLAMKLGIEKDALQRIDAGIEFVLQELAEDGHSCYPVDTFIEEAHQILEAEKALIQERIEALKGEGRVEVIPQVFGGSLLNFIWLRFLYLAEVGIAQELRRLQWGLSAIRKADPQKALEWVQDKLQMKLAEQQMQAVAKTLTDKLQIITGGPGTGKSTITKAILTICEKLTSKIALCAPTGKAAKRMNEITGRSASTIHSLLEYDFRKKGFKRDRQNPLECDLLIVDEASMIDTYLMWSLLKAVPEGARVIFVGDIYQLPSVGPGNVLKDMIHSGCLPVTTLTEIFRQAAGSRIVTNAHKINKGQLPDITNHSDSDFFFMELEDPQVILQQTVGLVTQRLPRTYALDPKKDIQVLAPMKKGIIGTENLNRVLQEALNASDTPLFRGGQKFLVGDKVMQLRNDYQKEVYNGDVGYVIDLDPREQQLVVQFDEREVVYEAADLDELTLAYAVSVHKYQGSECRCIVMPVHTSHWLLLHRNLLYTGVTRGKERVVLLGSKRALAIAVQTDDVKKRYTGLKGFMLDKTVKKEFTHV